MTADKKRKPGFIERFIVRIIVRLIINGCALYLAAQVIEGIHLDDWEAVLIVAIIFGVVNAFLKPLISLVTCLIRMITFGLFTLVINVGLLYLTEWIAHQVNLDFEIDNVLSAVLGALIVSVVSFVLSKILK